MKPRSMRRVLQRRWPVVGALAVAGVSGAVGYSVAQSQHQPTARVFVSSSTNSKVSSLLTATKLTDSATESYAKIAESAYVLEPVIAELGLRLTPAQLAQHVSSSVPKGTALIEIRAAGSSPAESARIANAVSQQLVYPSCAELRTC